MKLLVSMLTVWLPAGSWRKRLRNRLLNDLYSVRIRRKAAHVGPLLCVRGEMSVTRETRIGSGVSFGGGAIHGCGKCTIGSHVHLGPELLIITQNHRYEGNELPYDKTFVPKDVVIGDSVWIGARVTILPGTTIGEGAIIQAGSVVHGNIPPCAIAGGNPAKVFSSRDAEHYQLLKSQGRFFR